MKKKRKAIKTIQTTGVKTTKKPIRRRRSRPNYNCDTPVSALAKDYGIVVDAPPETNLGDFLESRGQHALVRAIRSLSKLLS